MTREDLLAELSELLERETPLTGPELLSELGNWDSMAVLSFMALVDDKCGITLAPTNIVKCVTVNDLIALTGIREKV